MYRYRYIRLDDKLYMLVFFIDYILDYRSIKSLEIYSTIFGIYYFICKKKNKRQKSHVISLYTKPVQISAA
jgi:hypothetical protein